MLHITTAAPRVMLRGCCMYCIASEPQYACQLSRSFRDASFSHL